jgi:hypothetical protein
MPITGRWGRAAAAPASSATTCKWRSIPSITCQAQAALGVEKLEAVADRGYFNGEEILACDRAEMTVTLPRPQRSGAKSEGRFGK